MYKKLSVIITTQKKRKKRKCVQSKTIDCEVIGKIKPVKGGWVDIDSIYKLNMFNSLHLFPHPFLLKVFVFSLIRLMRV